MILGIKELVTKSCWAQMPSSRFTMAEVAIELEQITKIPAPCLQYKLREMANVSPGVVPTVPAAGGEEENVDGGKKESKEFLTQYVAVTKKMGPTRDQKQRALKDASLDGSGKKIKKKKDPAANELDTSAKKLRRRSAPSPANNQKDESIRDEPADGIKKSCRSKKT